MFAKALLIYGPLPEKGWSVTRSASGEAFYVKAKGQDARRFQADVVQFFADDIRQRYMIRKWTQNHRLNVARKWKNHFFRWLWEKIDAT